MPRWTVSFVPQAVRDLDRLGSAERARVLRFLQERVAAADDPRLIGKALKADFAGAWRYRVGSIRIIVKLEYDALVVVVIAVANRGDVYRR